MRGRQELSILDDHLDDMLIVMHASTVSRRGMQVEDVHFDSMVLTIIPWMGFLVLAQDSLSQVLHPHHVHSDIMDRIMLDELVFKI